ncbi:MAG: hypothetical protein ACM3TN_18665 [Alphaproteobacteria bacterium]
MIPDIDKLIQDICISLLTIELEDPADAQAFEAEMVSLSRCLLAVREVLAQPGGPDEKLHARSKLASRVKSLELTCDGFQKNYAKPQSEFPTVGPKTTSAINSLISQIKMIEETGL